jgi:hypothetical protein
LIDIQLAILGILMVHLFFFVGFQYQVLNLLDEIAFPSNDPIMTSTLELEEEPEEAVEEEEEDAVEEWDAPVAEETIEEPEEELLDQTKCLGSNKNGNQCGRHPAADSTYCYRHQ